MLDGTNKRKIKKLKITLNYKFFDSYILMKNYLHIFFLKKDNRNYR